MALYSEKVMDHFRNPRNVGVIEDADGIGEVGNAKCGDIMKMYLKIDNDIITDVKFETFGCGNAPSRDWFIDIVREACARGKILLNVSQCLKGRVNMDLYATGKCPLYPISFSALATSAHFISPQNGKVCESWKRSLS